MSRALVRPLLVAVAGLLALLAVVGPAAACPFCAGRPDGRNEVREAIFDESFWPTALTAAVRFVDDPDRLAGHGGIVAALDTPRDKEK